MRFAIIKVQVDRDRSRENYYYHCTGTRLCWSLGLRYSVVERIICTMACHGGYSLNLTSIGIQKRIYTVHHLHFDVKVVSLRETYLQNNKHDLAVSVVYPLFIRL